MQRTYAEVGIASIIDNNNAIIIDIYSINQIPIAGVQFEIQPDNLFIIDSINGGICKELDFELYSNPKGLLLGFSLQGKEIPQSTNSNINDNILFSVYGKKNKDFLNKKITLKTTLAGKTGKKINAKVIDYVHRK